MPIIFYRFVCIYFKFNRFIHRVIFVISCILGGIFIIMDIFYPLEFFGELKFRFNEMWWVDFRCNFAPFVFFVYVSFYWLLLGYSFFLLLKAYTQSKGLLRNQVKYFIFGSLIGWGGAHSDWLVNFSSFLGKEIYPHLNFLIAIYPFIFVYSIFKYQLMDIKVIFTRTGIFLGVYLLLLGIPVIVGYSTGRWDISVFLLIIFAIAGPFIYRYLRIKAENLLFQRSRQYQKILLDSSEGLLRFKDKESLLSSLVSLILNNVSCSFVGIYILEEDKFCLKKLLPENMTLPEYLDKKEIAFKSILERQGVVFDFSIGDKIISLILPLGPKYNPEGFLFMGEKKSKEVYSEEDIHTFRTLLNQVSLALENINHLQKMLKEQEEKARLKKEMELARQIQISLLPQYTISLKDFHIEGLLLPAKEVAGDYYDYFIYSPEKVGIVVADVSGKGLDSGMVMSMTKSIITTLSNLNLSPRELVLSLNKNLYKQLHQQKFVSLIYGEYTLNDNTFKWAGAGQEYIIVIRNIGKVEAIKTGGVILGMFEDIEDKITEQYLTLEKGDKLVFYTDGVTESKNKKGEMFGLKRLIREIENICPKNSVHGILTSLKNILETYTHDTFQYDDITLVIAGRE